MASLACGPNSHPSTAENTDTRAPARNPRRGSGSGRADAISTPVLLLTRETPLSVGVGCQTANQRADVDVSALKHILLLITAELLTGEAGEK